MSQFYWPFGWLTTHFNGECLEQNESNGIKWNFLGERLLKNDSKGMPLNEVSSYSIAVITTVNNFNEMVN